MSNCNSILDRAGAWFLQSGIQEPDGGVARYYRSDLAINARISNEITGYAVSFLAYVYGRTRSDKYLDAALRAAHFLTRCAWDVDLELFPFEQASNASRPDPLAFFFDSGIIARGLLAAWHATGDREFFETALATGRGMLKHFRGAGVIHPMLTLPDRRPLPYQPRWSASPGCYQLKSAMAWQDLFELTGHEEFQEAYAAAVESALDAHDVFLPGDADCAKVMDRLHAYLYFLEGLLPVAGRPETRCAITSGIDRVAHYLLKIAPAFARSDVYAQLLRLRLYAASLDITPVDAASADYEASHASRFQFNSPDVHLEGGFCFGLKSSQPMPFVNPVSTAFCAQAIDLWQQFQQGTLATDLLTLV